ncbi:MAG: hypothetical protein H0V24_11445 [Chloroflexia bacterium]|nr:hypothetical protein [Chloroflexia bacterium]
MAVAAPAGNGRCHGVFRDCREQDDTVAAHGVTCIAERDAAAEHDCRRDTGSPCRRPWYY